MKMKSVTLTAIALATLALTTAPVFAEDSPQHSSSHEEDAQKGGPRVDDRHAEMEKRGKERFEKTDTNDDGFLSKDEMEAEHKARLDEMFSKTDGDKDGKLSPEELKKGREEMRAKFKERMKERHESKSENKSSE